MLPQRTCRGRRVEVGHSPSQDLRYVGRRNRRLSEGSGPGATWWAPGGTGAASARASFREVTSSAGGPHLGHQSLES